MNIQLKRRLAITGAVIFLLVGNDSFSTPSGYLGAWNFNFFDYVNYSNLAGKPNLAGTDSSVVLNTSQPAKSTVVNTDPQVVTTVNSEKFFPTNPPAAKTLPVSDADKLSSSVKMQAAMQGALFANPGTDGTELNKTPVAALAANAPAKIAENITTATTVTTAATTAPVNAVTSNVSAPSTTSSSSSTFGFQAPKSAGVVSGQLATTVNPADAAKQNTAVQNLIQANHETLQNAANQVRAAACVASVGSLNSSSTCAAATSANHPAPVTTSPVVAGSCDTQRVSVPGSHQYASEFMEKIVGAPNAVPPALFGLSADLSSAAIKAGGEAMYVSKSIDGGKTWTKVYQVSMDKIDSVQDGLYNGLGVSDDGKNIAFTTQKGVFALTQNGDHYDDSPKLSPADPSQPAATDVKISPDGQHMAASYGFFDHKATVVSYHLDHGNWVKDMIAPITTGSDVISLQYDPNGKLFAGTGNQVFSLNSSANGWDQVPIQLPSTTKEKNGKTHTVMKSVDDVSVYGMTFSKAGTAPNFTYTPNLAATCWGVFNIPAHTISRGRAYDVVTDPKNPMNVVRTTAAGADFSTDGGKSWKKIAGLPDCESTLTPGVMITTASSPACQDVWNVKNGKTPAHPKMEPETYPSEFRTAQFAADGSLLISGTSGTFLANPFGSSCH